MSEIKERIDRILERIESLRPQHDCRLMAVSKGQSWERIQAAMDAGVSLFGENRVQECGQKWLVRPHQVELRMIGRLQRNKVKSAIQVFSGIDTIDRETLADTLDRQLADQFSVMIEVNAGEENTKTGMLPAVVREFLETAERWPRLRFDGILAMLPEARDLSLAETKRIRRLMQETAELWRICKSEGWPWAPLDELSMGMTSDFEWALEAGATIVRIGQGIFGPRQ